MNGPRATICSCEHFSNALPSLFFPSVCFGDVALQDLTLNPDAEPLLVGIDVEIQGFGFSARASEDQEEFNGTTAAVVSQVTKVETRLLDCKI